MDTALHHEERLARMEQQQARIEAMVAALSQRFDDAIMTQLRDHGKRIRELETWKAWQLGYMACSAAVGAALGKFFL